jgi:hypothetical protein
MHRLLRAVWLVTAAAVAGAGVAAILTVVRGEPDFDDFRTVYSLPAVMLCGGAAIAALNVIERRRFFLLGAVALVASLVELVLFVLGIWKGVGFDGGGDSDYARLIPIALAWVIATIVLTTLVLIVSDRRLLLTIVPAVGTCALVGATLATVLVLQDNENLSWATTLAVLAILTVAGFLLTPLAERLTRPREGPRRA